MSHDRLNHLNGALMALSLGLLGFDLGEFGLQDDGPSVGVESFFVLPIAGVGVGEGFAREEGRRDGLVVAAGAHGQRGPAGGGRPP